MRFTLRLPWLLQTPLIRLPRLSPQNIVPRRIATTSSRNAAPVDLPRLIISPGSPHHNSLPTFIEWAKRTKLTPEKTVYVGTHYEYNAALALMRLGFSLLRIGRKNDAGIDLIGHWVLAPLREPLPIIAQCKARKGSLNPKHVRELEGSFQGIPADWRNKDVLGLLVTTHKATKGVLEALGQSTWPMGFVMISKGGLIQQFVWNRAASERGLEGVGVTLRHSLQPSSREAIKKDSQSVVPKKRVVKVSGTTKEIQLTWMGSPIFPERDALDQDTLKLMQIIGPADADLVAENPYKYRNERPNYGRPRTFLEPPSPLGGDVTRKRGRPKGSKNKPKKAATSK